MKIEDKMNINQISKSNGKAVLIAAAIIGMVGLECKKDRNIETPLERVVVESVVKDTLQNSSTLGGIAIGYLDPIIRRTVRLSDGKEITLDFNVLHGPSYIHRANYGGRPGVGDTLTEQNGVYSGGRLNKRYMPIEGNPDTLLFETH